MNTLSLPDDEHSRVQQQGFIDKQPKGAAIFLLSPLWLGNFFRRRWPRRNAPCYAPDWVQRRLLHPVRPCHQLGGHEGRRSHAAARSITPWGSQRDWTTNAPEPGEGAMPGGSTAHPSRNQPNTKP